jgi:hypothetical protein
VTVAATGGLGNQLFQLAAAMVLAQGTRRDVRVCCRMYDRPLARRLFVAARAAIRRTLTDRDGRFRIKAMERRPLILDVQRFAPETDRASDARMGFNRRSLKRSFRDPGHAIAGASILREAEEILAVVDGRQPIPPGSTPLIAGHMQDDRLVEPVIADLRARLELPRDTPYLSRWLPRVDAQTVGVHVRRGDYLKPAFRGMLPVLRAAWFDSAAQIVRQRHGDVRFLVVTDDPAWARDRLRLPGPTEVASLDHPSSPLDDLVLLSRCAHHVISNSTFGWWGARLSTAGGSVIVPTRWSFRPPTPPNLLPASWHALDNPEDDR